MKKRTLLLIPLLGLTLPGCNTLQEWLPLTDNQQTSPPQNTHRQVSKAEVYYRLGVRRASGQDGTTDYTKAVDTFEKAAHLGHHDAQYMLGMAYLNGKGTQSNSADAIRWLESAAQQGHAKAQYTLGELYLNGHGISAEEAWGVHWFIRSATQGYGPAQYATGVAYATGMGVVQDRSEAWFWLKLARRNKQDGAQAVLDKLQTMLSSDALTKAEARYTRWTPKRYTTVISPVEIQFIQHSLNLLGYPAGTVDGIMGPNTRKGIGVYTSDRGLPGIGDNVNSDLINAIRSEMAA